MGRHGLPDPLSRLIESLSRLPGIGEKSATRLAFHILAMRGEHADNLMMAIEETRNNIRLCSACYSFTSNDPCEICRSAGRDRSKICVVEGPIDLIAVERSGEFRGLYHVLHGVISPLDGVGPDDLKIRELAERVKTGEVEELIIATNPSVEGEATSLYIARIMHPLDVEVSRIAYGVPVGSSLEYIDEMTLGKAMKDRKRIEV